jgi:hypothetical protein
MLIYDGHDTHMTKTFLTYLWDNRIIHILIPAYNSYFMQPCDCGPFQPLKQAHRTAVSDATRRGVGNFNNINLFYNMHEIREKVFTIHNIKAGFKRTGIYPYNPQRIYDFIEANKIVVPPANPQLDMSYLNDEIPDTPLTPLTTKKRALELVARLTDGEVITPRIQRNILTFAIQTVKLAHKARILEAQLFISMAAQQAGSKQQQSHKRSFGRKVGIMYIEDGREIIEADTEADTAAKARKAVRLAKEAEDEDFVNIAAKRDHDLKPYLNRW